LCIHTEPLLGSIIGKLDYRIEIQNTEYRSQRSEDSGPAAVPQEWTPVHDR